MRQRLPWFLAALLLVSAGLNVHQWRARAGSAGAPTAAPTPPPGTGVRAAATAAPATKPPGTPPATPAGTSIPADGVAPPSCPAQLEALSRRLAEAEAEVERFLPPGERFERGAPSPDLQRRLEAELAPLLADAPKGWSHDLECRGSTCRLELVHPEGDHSFDWMGRIQGEDRPRLSVGMSFSGGRPTRDPVSGEALQTEVVDLMMAPADAVPGAEILADIAARFRLSTIPACEARHPAEGRWSGQLILDEVTRAIRLEVGGDLAGHAVGACLADGLERLAGATAVPPTVMPAVLHVRVDLPSP